MKYLSFALGNAFVQNALSPLKTYNYELRKLESNNHNAFFILLNISNYSSFNL